MKLLVTIGLRLLGVALVVYILATQVDYLDHLELESGEAYAGRIVVSGETAAFYEEPGINVIDLGFDWREDQRLRLGLLTIIETSDKLLLALAVFIFGPITLISITRWWYLLRTVDVPIRFAEAFRLTFIGFFFNSAVPGMTGGDLVKGAYIARQASNARVRAFMSVLVDRVIGLFALGVLAAIVLVPNLADSRFHIPATIVFVFLGISIAFGCLFLSGRLRRLFRFEKLVTKLPLSKAFVEIDRAIVIYRQYPRAVLVSILLSVANHVTLVAMAAGMGRAIGIEIPIVQFFMLYPVCIMMASIPLLPGGWGLREASFQTFFGMVGVAATQAVALSILVGLTMLGWSLLGGVIFLLRPDRVSKTELAEFHERVDAEIDSPES